MSAPDAQNYIQDRAPDRAAVEEDVERTSRSGAAIAFPLVVMLLVGAHRIHDVDTTDEEADQAIVTSGVAIGESAAESA